MYIKEIKINGFKSFADKIALELNRTFTGIVGPNGSGKSNIVDAVKWVLGEQSIKTLRGATGMSDVIFSGSKSRDAKNAASVSISFDNTNHELNIDYDIVEVKRIVYRSGENEYYLNGQRCRLKDITDLFLDSFSTKDGINIIAQGKVAEILSNKAEDRRIIFEEASGVLKYKKRKEESLRKLAKTHDNLSRINMIINELESQVEPLKKESEKANKYNKIKKELTNIDVALITNDISKKYINLEENKKRVTSLKENIAYKTSENRKLETEIEENKVKLIELESEESKIREDLNNVTTNLSNTLQKKELLIERTKYDKNSDEVKNNLIAVKEKQLLLQNEIESVTRVIIDKKSEKQKLDEFITKLEKENSSLNKRLEIIKSEYNDIIRQEITLQNKKQILENNIQNNELVPYSVKYILNSHVDKVHDVVGNLITTDNKYLNMLNVAIQSVQNYIVVDDEDTAKKCINLLKEKKSGRATFLPISVIKPKKVDEIILDKIKRDESFIGIASELTNYSNIYSDIMSNLLGTTLVVKTIDDAVRISKLIYNRYRIITLNGDVINVGGSMTGGSLKTNNSIISEKYELESINENIKNIEIRKEEIIKEEKELEFKFNDIKNQIYKNNVEIVSIKEFISTKETLLNNDKAENDKLQSEINDLSNDSKDEIDKNISNIMNKYYNLENHKKELEYNLNNNIKEQKNIKEYISESEIIVKKSNNDEKMKMENINKLEIDITKDNIFIDNLLVKLNEEYGLTYEKAKQNYILEIDEDTARIKVSDLKRDIKLLGNINLNSIEDYERINKRYTFMETQKEDLQNSEANLLEIIKSMDEQMIEKFSKTFNKINIEFNKVFKELFNGGEARLELTDPNNMLETGIDIIAYPPGKKPTNISLLSGGEKTLTAISLLFSIMNLKQVPFVILDEVESALDEANVERFCKYLNNYKGKTQLLIITHKKKTMEFVDLLYGITMEESGVSKLVSVRLDDK